MGLLLPSSVKATDISPGGSGGTPGVETFSADSILIRSVASSAVALDVRIRTRDAANRANDITHTHTTAATRANVDSESPLNNEYLESVIVTAPAATDHGAVYVRVFLKSKGKIVTLLADGYISTFNHVGWPINSKGSIDLTRGLIRSVSGTDPAANTDIAEAVPTGARWRLISFLATLVTANDAAGNRTVIFSITDGTNDMYVGPSASALHAQNTTAIHQLMFNANRIDAATTVVSGTGYIYHHFPDPPMMMEGWKIVSATANMQATDNWGAPRLWVEEWLEE